jgi:hypothetical protein
MNQQPNQFSILNYHNIMVLNLLDLQFYIVQLSQLKESVINH